MKTIYGYIGILIAACCIGGFTGNVYHQPAATK